MSDHEQEPSEPRPSTLRLVRAIGMRLRAPLGSEQRDVLVAALVDATSGDELAVRRRTLRGVPRRRFAAAAAALVVISGAVGVAVAVRSTDDLPVIVLASGPQAAGSAALDAGARGAAGGPEMMRADASPMIGLWIPTIYTFVLDEGVRVSDDRAPAWRMAPPADLLAAATQLAAALGLPAPGPSEWDPAALTAQDATGASLWVSPGGDWYYGGPSDLWPVWDCPEIAHEERDAGDGAPGRDAPVECTPPEPPSGVPSADRARTLALEQLARLGVGQVRILDVHGDEWGASVQAELSIPGSPLSSGLFVGIGFAGEARLAWANGTLARPERIGDYPLLGLTAALDRLEQGLNAWVEDGVFPMPYPFPADVTGDDDTPVSILPVPDATDEGDVPDEGGPSWEDQEPVQRTVRIVSVEIVMNVTWSPGDVQLLLPNYRLIDEDGGWWFVIALEDRHLSR
jgi:hypothetical protein